MLALEYKNSQDSGGKRLNYDGIFNDHFM